MALLAGENADAERVTVWQCIGCGKIDAPQPCIGVCQDRKVQFVYASLHDEALAQLACARERAKALEGLVRRPARTTPREGEWERTYRVMQDQARQTLGALAADAAPDAGRS